MTIVNVLIHDGYAMLITDTKATSTFGRDFHVYKVKEMPHMRLAVATRGAINAHLYDSILFSCSSNDASDIGL
ncbi:hypothetical protein G6L13_20015 [Agrobacterium tumefaciens]|uniref:hypothetical protein n=1 Tax=Agrobacterium tumefaciens TaxID=358 RepID=UPI0015738C4B|nr:hypothetical protein [Agrobacterium tumefaciens]NTA82784.1 hypothetical protein [Agrobacterium tumefaciens]